MPHSFNQNSCDQTLPARAGVGLKTQHMKTILENLPDIGWFEVHPENYMSEGGLQHYFLTEIAQHYPLSFHGVGLSLGSADGINADHLQALKKLVDRYQPAQISEHLAWSHWNSIFLNDLLPLSYTQQNLQTICNNIDHVQTVLGRSILIENPSVYIELLDSCMSEAEFLNEIVSRSGCGLLLDVNNIYVSCNNIGSSSHDYINAINRKDIIEIHLAGHAKEIVAGETVCIDDHGSPVCDKVWSLYAYTLKQLQRPVPTLIEWDTDIPQWSTLLNEATQADILLNHHCPDLQTATQSKVS